MPIIRFPNAEARRLIEKLRHQRVQRGAREDAASSFFTEDDAQ
jgi:hypothetical protein